MASLVVALIAMILSVQPVAQAEPRIHNGVKTSQIQHNHTMAGQDRFNSRMISIGIDPSTPKYEQQSLTKAVAKWNQGGIVTLVIKPYNVHDDILVDNATIPKAKGKDYWILGNTTPTVQNGHIIHSHIEIDPHNVAHVCDYERPLVDDTMIDTLEHEIGHALGLPHVTNPDACMYPVDQGPLTNFDYGLLDRLYSDQNTPYSRVYHLPMDSGFTVNNQNYHDWLDMQSIPYKLTGKRCFEYWKGCWMMGLVVSGYAVLLSIACVSHGIKLLDD